MRVGVVASLAVGMSVLAVAASCRNPDPPRLPDDRVELGGDPIGAIATPGGPPQTSTHTGTETMTGTSTGTSTPTGTVTATDAEGTEARL